MMAAGRDDAESGARANASPIQLGLIGDNIAQSRAPHLHRIAGELCRLNVSYDLLVPDEIGKDFDGIFEACRDGGFRGLNITYPYKQSAASRVEIDDPIVRRMGVINTVLFEAGRATGHNTDYTGFVAAYHDAFGAQPPGVVAQVGAGGVGCAIAFALVELGATALRLCDIDVSRAEALAETLCAISPRNTEIVVSEDAAVALNGAEAVINCTPIGMAGHPGSPVAAACFNGLRWAFDAVYTPSHTPFRAHAEAAGATFLSGYELFFHQGVQAFRLFTGQEPPDLSALRARLRTVATS